MSAHRRQFLLAWLALASMWLAARAPAVEADKLFENGNKLYEERRYPEAAAAYEAILTAGQASPAIYFNLGNAYFKANQTGRAIVAYRQAQQLTPRDPDVSANLRFARNQVEGPTLKPTRWQRAIGTLSLNEWAALSVAGLWLTFALLALAQWRPALKSSLRLATLLAGSGTLVVALCLVVSLTNNTAANTVVVTGKDVFVRNGPLEESQSAFTAHDGAELRVLDRKEDWLQVTDGTRRSGWLQRSAVAAK